MIDQIISYLEITFFSFLYNIPYVTFIINSPYIETEFYLYNNIITSILLISGAILLEYLLVLLGKKIYKKSKYNFNKHYIGNLYFLAFFIRFIPILGHIGSIIMGMNNINMKKIIKIYLLGYSFFLFIGYLIIKFDIFYLFVWWLY